MFARVAVFLLLLLLNVLAIEAVGKIHDSLKKVGKRFGSALLKDPERYRAHLRAVDVVNAERDRKKWESLSDDKIKDFKDKFAKKLVNQFVEASSQEHEYFKESLEWIESILSDDVQVEICGSPDKMNMIQYTKYMEKAATQYIKVPETTLKQYELVDTPEKKEMKMYMIFEQEDKNGVKSFMRHDLNLNLTFGRPILTMPFQITKITQGSECPAHTDVKYKTVDRLGEIVEDLKNHPTPQSFFKLFAPRTSEITEESKFEAPYVHNLPVLWLNHLSENAVFKIENADTTFEHGKAKFKEWYEKFGMMWHPAYGDGHPFKMEVTQLQGKDLTVKITMPLQIGVNLTAKIHNWVLQAVAEQDSSGSWVINAVGIYHPTPKSFDNLMNEYYLVYQEVMGNVFSHYIVDEKVWWMATDFAQHFRKYGEEVKVTYCGDEIKTREQFPKRFIRIHTLYNSTMVGFFIKNQLEPLPAQEETTVQLRVVMKPPFKLPGKRQYGSDWKFYIRWDKEIQFYYIYQAEFACAAPLDPEDGDWRHTVCIPSPEEHLFAEAYLNITVPERYKQPSFFSWCRRDSPTEKFRLNPFTTKSP